MELTLSRLLQEQEIVMYDTDIGMKAHLELFKFNRSVYYNLISFNKEVSKGDLSHLCGDATPHHLYESIIAVIKIVNFLQSSHLFTLHFVLNMENIGRLATWCFDNSLFTRITDLLSNKRIYFEDIDYPDILDITGFFSYLLTNSKFNVLRKFCHLAKENISALIEIKNFQVICHMISNNTKTIIASSL